MNKVILSIVLAIFLMSNTPLESSATTIQTVDMGGYQLIGIGSASCGGTPMGSVIYTNCWGGEGQFLRGDESDLFAFFTADLSSLSGISFDHVYFSLTEIRTASWATGTSNVYVTDNELPADRDSSSADVFLLNVDNTLASGITSVGTLTGTGIGGNQLFLDVTDTINSSILNNNNLVSFLFQDAIDDGVILGILGSNYNSGLMSCADGVDQNGRCQYYASSLYEYPSLIATIGTEITPFAQLPSRPILDDPLFPGGGGQPNPNPVPEPAPLLLLGTGIAGLVWQRRKTIR